MARPDAAERVLNLLTLLKESPRPLTRGEIVDRMRDSTPYPHDAAAQRQAFKADRRTITEELGVAIHMAVRAGDPSGREEYWIDPADIELPDLALDDEEKLLLAIALGAVSRRVPGAGEALLKLGPAEAGDGPFEFNVDVPPEVTMLIDVARDAAVVEVVVPGSQFEFEPWVVLLDNATWVAVGHDPALGAPRGVRLDRLLAAPRRLDRQASVPRRSLPTERLRAIARAAEGSDPAIATVSVDPIAAARAGLSPLVRKRSQVNLFGTVELTVDVTDQVRFRNWFLALGDHAAVVAPQELRDSTAAWLRAIVDAEPSGAVAPPKPRAGPRRTGPEPASHRLHRLLAVVPWLSQRESVPIDDLATRLRIPPKHVVRDLTMASMCGVPPYTPDCLFGFSVDGDEVRVLATTLFDTAVRLTPRQARAVGVALAALEALPGGEPDSLVGLRAKLTAAIGEIPVRVSLDDPPFLDDVRAAVEGRDQIRIEYVDPGDRLTERTIDAQRIFIDRGASYVAAHDHLRGGEQRNFRIDRIVSLEPTGHRFEPRPVEIPASDEGWTWEVPATDVVVRLPPGNDWVLDRYPSSAHARDGDGSVTVWLSVVSERWLATLLLGAGAGAEVLDPPEYADLASRRAAAILARYDDT